MPRHFDQLGSVQITKHRNMVLSRCDNGGFTIAQQLVTDEDGKVTKVFMKGAIFVDGVESLRSVNNLLRRVLKSVEEQEATDWDDVVGPDADVEL